MPYHTCTAYEVIVAMLHRDIVAMLHRDMYGGHKQDHCSAFLTSKQTFLRSVGNSRQILVIYHQKELANRKMPLCQKWSSSSVIKHTCSSVFCLCEVLRHAWRRVSSSSPVLLCECVESWVEASTLFLHVPQCTTVQMMWPACTVYVQCHDCTTLY